MFIDTYEVKEIFNKGWVVCVTEDEPVAKDLCSKFGYNYNVETVGEERNTPDYVESREPHEFR